MLSTNHFDYIIIGNGLAGLQLALEFSKDTFFDDKQFALIDVSDKNKNDKTWCFWEKGIGKWDHIVYKNWNAAKFYSSTKTLNLDLNPYKYKMIRSSDFYQDAKDRLSKKENFHFIIDQVTHVEENELVRITTENTSYSASHVFDSRISDSFFNNSDKYTRINQHFKGWIIETKNGVFNPESFTMMDYRLKDGKQTTFTYVLPFSTKKALVEFTYFTEHIVDDKIYDNYLKQYLANFLKIEDYEILEVETGNIPMTDFPFENESSKNITKIGTAAGWVKGSTGYSFKHTEKNVAKIIENIKFNNIISKDLNNKKYQFYDAIFLKVLKDENDKGEWVFEQFYSKNPVETMFKFLDEDSSIFEELKIMHSLFSFSFIKAFFKTLFF
ncbi:lycopene cyclase family protein [Gaetbulibacter aquiaggeris]|uniref:Lycopene cyclase family protein n=1 Tax=Gaetbulibacter aquiaggeris TaxID=1735373 RepID=A0ABW7MNZ0_9FLAO